MIIKIADLPIEWQNDYSDFAVRFKDDTDSRPIISLNFLRQMNECHGIQYTDENAHHFLRLSNGDVLCSNDDWSTATVYSPHKFNDHSLPLAAICSKFSEYNTLFLHSSLVNINNNGIIFTGFSGVGKTTQAILWQKYLNAEIINGDKAFVRCFDDRVVAYGCPWKGSSEFCLNKKTTLKGIVVLKQSKENRITRLDSLSAVEFFMPHIFLPHWDSKCLEKSLDTFSELIAKVPVWLLECKADEEAVKLTYDTVLK